MEFICRLLKVTNLKLIKNGCKDQFNHTNNNNKFQNYFNITILEKNKWIDSIDFLK